MRRVFAILMATAVILALCVPAFADDVETEADTVSVIDYEQAADAIKDAFPEQYATIERYYNSCIEAVRNAGMLQSVSDYCLDRADEILTVLFGLSFVAAVVFFIIDRTNLRKKSIKSSNESKNMYNETAVAVNSSEARVSGICRTAEENIATICARSEEVNAQLLARSNEIAERSVESVRLSSDEFRYALCIVARSQRLSADALGDMLGEMDIKPSTKVAIREKLNASIKEVIALEKSVEKADAEG